MGETEVHRGESEAQKNKLRCAGDTNEANVNLNLGEVMAVGLLDRAIGSDTVIQMFKFVQILALPVSPG